MARAVAEIDGDSSGLVGALDQGKKGMEKLEAEGKKLSDQLREVTDSADKAAGALVQRIGGPTAIKAIAGVGIAFGAAKMGVDAFLGSAESLFKSFGDEGMKVWDETEKGLFAIKGAFAEAVLGGGSMEEMGERLRAIFGGVKLALEVALLPIRLVSEGIWAIAGAVDGLSLAESNAQANETRYREALDGTLRSIREQKIAYDELGKTLGDVVISKQEAARLEYESTLASIDAQIAANDENRAYRANAAAELAAAKAAELLFASSIASTRDKADRELRIINDGVRQSQRDVEARAREMLLEDQRFRTQLFIAQEDARAQAIANNSGMTQDEIDRQNELLRRRENFVQKAEELNFRLWNPEKPASTTGGGGGAPKAPTVDPVAAAIKAAAAAGSKAMADAQDQFTADAQKTKDAVRGFFTGFNPSEGWVDSWRTAVDGVKEVYAGFVTAILGGNQKIEESNEVVLTKEQEGMRANYDQFVNQNAKQVAVAIAGGATIADAARAALGNIVTALGDKAMSQAAIEFATGNIPGAVALTAAGAAAYATGAYLGATDKKSGSATKATAKEAAVTNNQTNYNLRVDAAFADEEGIARAFAKAQRLANTRYLGSAAY